MFFLCRSIYRIDIVLWNHKQIEKATTMNTLGSVGKQYIQHLRGATVTTSIYMCIYRVFLLNWAKIAERFWGLFWIENLLNFLEISRQKLYFPQKQFVLSKKYKTQKSCLIKFHMKWNQQSNISISPQNKTKVVKHPFVEKSCWRWPILQKYCLLRFWTCVPNMCYSSLILWGDIIQKIQFFLRILMVYNCLRKNIHASDIHNDKGFLNQ